MTGAVIALAAALLAAVGGLIAFGLAAIAATKRAGDVEGAERELAVRLEVANANTETEKRRADAEKERGDALDAAIVEHAAAGPVAGSYERLLQARKAASAAGGGSPAVVRDGGDARVAASAVGSDELLKPGE